MSEKGTIASGAGKRFSISNMLPSPLWEYACQTERLRTSFPLLFFVCFLFFLKKRKKDIEMKTEIQTRS